MRRLLIVSGVLVLLFVGVLVAAVVVLDPDDLRGPLVSTLEQSLGREVSVGKLELELFPLPGVGVSDVRIAGDTPDAAPLAEVAQVRLRPSLLALLGGQVVVRTLEIRAPRIHLETDAEGNPVPPEFGDGSGAAPPPAQTQEAAGGSAPALAIETIVIEDGRLEAGPWIVENLFVEGALHLDGSADIDARADLAGLSELRDVTAKLAGLLEPPLVVDVEGRLENLRYDELARRLELEGLSGASGARFSARVEDAVVTAGRLELEDAELDYSTPDLELRGPVKLVAELGGRFEADLTATELIVPETLRKPPGEVLRATGTLPKAVPPTALDDVELHVGPNKLPMRIDLAGATPVVQLKPAAVELAPLIAWLEEPPEGIDGRIVIEAFEVRAEPLALDGKAQIEQVSVALEGGKAVLYGPVTAKGTTIVAKPLRIVVGEQTFDASATYDVDSGRYTLDTSGDGADTAALTRVVTGRPDLSGLLALTADVQGDAEGLPTLKGKGRFEIKDGELQGESIAKQALGQFAAALPLLQGQKQGKDLSRYMKNQFEEVSATYTISNGKLSTRDLLIVQTGARVELAGSIGLVDGALDLRGRLILRKELDKELGGEGEGQEKVIPITGIGGTVTSPRVKLDQRVLTQVGYTYLQQSEQGKQLNQALEERLGKEGSEAVQGLLKGILGGGRPPPPPPQEPKAPQEAAP